jgi:hypothetical protein
MLRITSGRLRRIAAAGCLARNANKQGGRGSKREKEEKQENATSLL